MDDGGIVNNDEYFGSLINARLFIRTNNSYPEDVSFRRLWIVRFDLLYIL